MSSTKQRIILVTGANKGIGFEVVKKLAKNSSTIDDDVILLGSRDLTRGQDAIKQLGSPPNVHLFQLDSSSKESIARATNEIKQKFGGQLDVIINNAGIAKQGSSIEDARETFATNYYGIKTLNEHMAPLLRENGRIINVASEVGAWVMHGASKDLQDQYTSPTLTVEQLDRLVEDFLSAVESKTLEKVGYTTKLPIMQYGTSKSALIALTQIEARQRYGNKNIFAYAVCPGYCSTDLNNHGAGSRSPAEGADSILYVVNTPNDQLKNGSFYQDGKQLPQIGIDEAKLQGIMELQKKASTKN